MAKQSTSISIEGWKKERLDTMGLSLTKIVDRAIDAYISGEMEDVAVSAQISLIEDEIENLKTEIFTMSRRVVFARTRLKTLESKRESIEVDWKHARYTSRVAGVTRKLNYVILAAKYHIPTIKDSGSEYIEELRGLNPEFDLEAHVKRFQIIMDS